MLKGRSSRTQGRLTRAQILQVLNIESPPWKSLSVRVKVRSGPRELPDNFSLP